MARYQRDRCVCQRRRAVSRSMCQGHARPLPAAQLVRMAGGCPGDLAGLRDRALLLLAAAGLGRTALVSLDAEQIHVTATGVDLILHSQTGVDRTATVQRAAPLTNCPV